MAGRNSSIAWATLPDRRAVDQTIQRLTQNGFSRNSIDVTRRPDNKFDIHVNTTEANLPRVESLIHASSSVYALRETRAKVADTVTSHPLITAGAVAVLGFAVVSLLGRRRMTVQSLTELPRTIRELPVNEWMDDVRETAVGMAEAVQDTVRSTMEALPESVSGPISGAAGTVSDAARATADKVINLGGPSQGQGQPQGGQSGQPQGQGSQQPGSGSQPFGAASLTGQPGTHSPTQGGMGGTQDAPNRTGGPQSTATTTSPAAASGPATTPPQSTGQTPQTTGTGGSTPGTTKPTDQKKTGH
jgi:hypothetical protein